MRDNIENPYKVNANHHYDKAMSADFVQVFRRGKLLWIVYLFSAGAVTPMRTVEFSKLNDCEEWAKNKGCDVWTYFSLDLEDVNADMRIISRNHGTGKVIARTWSEELLDKITSSYSLADIEEVISMLMNSDSVNCPNATFTLVHKDVVKACVRCHNAFVVSDTMPDQIFCSEMCWQLDKSTDAKLYPDLYRTGQTIDFQSCLKKDRLNDIIADAKDLASIEYLKDDYIMDAEIVFIDDNGCQHEYDGVCLSEGKLKISIKKTQ